MAMMLTEEVEHILLVTSYPLCTAWALVGKYLTGMLDFSKKWKCYKLRLMNVPYFSLGAIYVGIAFNSGFEQTCHNEVHSLKPKLKHVQVRCLFLPKRI